MSVSEPFIRRPVGTALLAFGLFLLGVVAYHFLPVAPVPRVDYPVILVSATLPGADPATMASSVAAPLERRLGQISGVSEMTSISTLGGTSVTIQFDLNRKVDGAARDVQAAINAARGDLPLDLPGPPTYHKINPADSPIMILAMSSETLASTTVFESADEVVGQKLSQVEGVSQAFVTGAEKSAVRVQVDPVALASVGFSLEDVRSLLGKVNVDSPKGSLDGSQNSYTIASNDQLFDASQYQSLILTQKSGVPVQLSMLGKVLAGVENARLGGWSGTNRAVLIIVQKQAGANVIETVDRIKAVLPQIQKWIPPSIKLTLVSDRTTTIRAAFKDVQISLALSVVLVVLVIFLFLRRFWPTFIACIAIPLAIAGSLGFMYLFDYSLDNLSLMAITICVGFVVDDAIVVIENVYRFIERGDPAMDSALKGAKQIGFTVVSMSLSLVAVFIPILFMGGLIGRLFHEFAVTLSLAILVSGVISLTLTPMLCSRFLKAEREYGPPNFFYRASEASFKAVLRGYERSLKWVLKHQVIMLVVTVLTFIATVALYFFVPKGFFPQQDSGVLIGVTEAAQDISFPAMSALQQKVARIVLDDPAVLSLGSFIGESRGSGTLNNGRMFITLKPVSERKERGDAVINRLRAKLARVEGITLFLQPVQDIRMGGRSGKAQFQYALQTADLTELTHWSGLLLQRLQQIKELKDVSSDQQTAGLQANVVVNRDTAARLGISPEAIDNTLYDAFGQRQVSTLYKRYNQHHVILEVDPQFQLNPESLKKIYVTSNTGAQTPLATVARFVRTNSSLSVTHQGQFPATLISFNLNTNVSLGMATELIQRATEDLHMPARVSGSFQGTAQIFKSSLSNMPMLLAAALIAVYVVLGMLYESLVHPLTILSTLPSAGVGALLALILTGYDLSLVSFIGIILLMGIVKKNAIMMVDFAVETQRNERSTPEHAILQACVIRFRPIMMTTMAALLGTLPLALGLGAGSELRRPLGIAVVGGLCLSQVLTLYTTPVVYLAIEHVRARVHSWRHHSPPQLAPAT